MAGGPLPRTTGTKWFQYKPKKGETQAHANARAYLAYVDYENRWKQQWLADNPVAAWVNKGNIPEYNYTPGHTDVRFPLPNYSTAQTYKSTPSVDVQKATKAPKKPKKVTPKIIEPSTGTGVSTPSPTGSEAHQKTVKLRNQQATIVDMMNTLMKNAKAGLAPPPKPPKKPGLVTQAANVAEAIPVLGGVLHLGRKVAKTPPGEAAGRDVVGPALRFLSRAGAATGGFAQSAFEHGASLSSDPLYGGTPETPDPSTTKAYQNWTPEQKAAADAAYKRLRETAGRNPLYVAKRGITGKEQNDWNEYNTLKYIATHGYAPKGVMKGVMIGGSLTEAIGTDPLTYGGGIVPKIKGLTAVDRAENAYRATQALVPTLEERAVQGSQTYAELQRLDQVARDAEEAYKANKTAKGLKNVQEANKIANQFRQDGAAKIRIELLNSGITPAELASLKITQHPWVQSLTGGIGTGKDTIEIHDAARQILKEAEKTHARIDPHYINAKVAEVANKMAKEPLVQEAADTATYDKIQAIRQKNPLAAGAANRQALYDESIAEIVQPRADQLRSVLTDAATKRLGFTGVYKGLESIPGMEKSLRALYIPFEATGKGLQGTKVGNAFYKTFAMGAHFPGEAETARRITEAAGVAMNGDIADRVYNITKNFNPAQKYEIAHAIEMGQTLSDPAMEAARQEIVDLQDKLFQLGVDAGKYRPQDKVKNYLFHDYHGEDPRAWQLAKRERKAAMRAGKQGLTLKAADAAGFKPSMEIDKIMYAHARDAVRTAQKYGFRTQIMSNFGQLMDNPELAHILGLQEVPMNELTPLMQNAAKAKNAKWYLDPEIHDTFKAMDKMMSAVGAQETNPIMNILDKFTHQFKTQATVLNPGNWVNNTAGDVFMNYVDHVRDPSWYIKSFKMLRMQEGDPPKNIKLAGHNFDSQEVMDAFKEKAPSGGFIRTEGKFSQKRFVRGGQNMYESREEWSRLAHFMSATDEEMRILLRENPGMTVQEAFDAATERAAKRVAKWNIDYTAITPNERMLRKRYIPFYTFMRKSVPLMMEGMVTRPGVFSHIAATNKAMEQFIMSFQKQPSDVTLPYWLQQAGGMRLTSGNEPYFLRNTSPLYSINRLFGGTGPADVVRNIMNQANPLTKIPIEVAYQRSLFNKQPITKWSNYALQQIPFLTSLGRLGGVDTSVGQTSTPTSPLWERLASYAGIPISHLTENQQQAEIHRETAKINWPAQTKEINAQLAPYEVRKTHSKTHGDYYTIRRGKVMQPGRYRDYNDAVTAAYGMWKKDHALTP